MTGSRPETRSATRGAPWVLCGYVIFAFLYYVPALHAPVRVHGMPVMPLWYVLLRDGVWLGLCAATFVYWVRHRGQGTWRMDRPAVILLRLLAAAAVVMVSTSILQVRYRGLLSVLQHDIRNLLMYGAVIVMLPVWLPDRGALERLWNRVWVLALVAAVVGICQVLVFPKTTWLTRATSVVNNPNNLSWVCLLGFTINAGWIAARRALFWPTLLFGGILVAGIAGTQSIAAHISLTVIGLTMLALTAKGRRGAVGWYLVGSVAIGLALGFFMGSTPLMVEKIMASVGPGATRRTMRAREASMSESADYVLKGLAGSQAMRLLLAAGGRDTAAEGSEGYEQVPSLDQFLLYAGRVRVGLEDESFQRNESVFLNLLYNNGLFAAAAMFGALLGAGVLAVKRAWRARRAEDRAAEAVALGIGVMLLVSTVVSFNLNPLLYRFPINFLTYLLVGLSVYLGCPPARPERGSLR